MGLEDKIWRIVELDKQDGYFNTALDEALLGLIESGITPPSIVFTQWKPTISVGRTQDVLLDVDMDVTRSYGIDVLRRKSGGQAVYLDEGYIVFSILGTKNYFSEDWSRLRQSVCLVVKDALNHFGIPADFTKPDNVVIYDNFLKTIGNSGQIIKQRSMGLHCGIRYDFLDYQRMIDSLKINGVKLNPYSQDIRNHLTCIKEYCKNVGKKQIMDYLVHAFVHAFGGNSFYEDLTAFEIGRIQALASDQYCSDEWNIYDPTMKKSKGICYLFVNGKNIVPSLEPLLPYNKPSGLVEAMM